MLATNLGLALGLPMPRVEVIEVSDWLIEHTEDLRIQSWWCQDSVPERQAIGIAVRGLRESWHDIRLLASRAAAEGSLMLSDFARVLVLDKWTCNSDGRQAIFCRKTLRSQRYTATFIDQGYCFNAGEWSFPDCPLRGVYANNCVYEGVTGWEAFEPALTRAEEMDSHDLAVCGRDSGRVVRRRSRRSESVGGGAAPSPWGDSEVDHRIS